MLDRFFDALAKLCLRHSKQIAIAGLIVGVIAFAGASRIHFDPDLLNLIPQKNREVNEFRKVLRDLGTLDNHVVVLQLPKGADINTYDSLIESIAQGYRKNARIEEVQYRIPNPLDFVEIVLPRAMLFLTPEELEQVAQKLSDDGIRQNVARNRALLQTPQSFALKQLIQYDPFNLAPIFLGKFASAGGGFSIDASSGYYLSADHTMLLILAKPRRPAQDVPFAKELLADGRQIEAQALAEFKKSNPNAALPVIEHTGGYQIAAGDADLIRGDVIVNILGSFFGVLGLFLYAFRRPAAVVYGAVPMGLALLMTFGIAGAVYGQLSSASAGFAALLARLGIDFITVMYGRYVDERNRGATMPHGIVTAIRASLPGVAVAAFTTAATFYAFLATDFRGMTQLGFLTGTGVLFFLLCTALMLPALIVISERHGAKKAPKLFLHSFGSEKLIGASLRNPRRTITIWVVFIAICAVFSVRLRFSDNIQDLRAKGNAGVVNQEKVTKKFGQSFEFMMYVIEGKTQDEVITRTHAAARELRGLVADKTIGSYQSIATFVPPREEQLAVIRTLDAGRADRFNYDRINKTFRAALEENGFRSEAYDSYMELFAQTLAPKEPISLDTLNDPDLLTFLRRFVKQTKEGWMSVTYIYPAGSKWPRDVPPKLLALNERTGGILTGINLVSGTLRRIVRADAVRSTTIGLVAVIVIMIVSFRRLRPAMLTFVPFLAGAIAMLGLMAIGGLQFNFMNIFVGLMIIGCGTDYAVYILHRYAESPKDFGVTAPETGKAVVMAALTTIVGYGSFALSHYPGLRSIGYASFFGIFFSGLAAITLLPAILVSGRESDE
ncbi:MAG TPA: MMPL family transporter [Thermoanaerobaculia bacterium]|nr:MMPL family transporter [Thermoanaerobaculia bacterium]